MKTTARVLALVGSGLLGIFSVGCGSTVREPGTDGAKGGAGSVAGSGGSSSASIAENAGGTASEPTDDDAAGSAGAKGDSSKDPTDACGEYARAVCHKIAACNAWVISSYFESEAACVKRYTEAVGCVGSFALRGTSRTVAQLEACTVATNRSTCAEWLDEDATALASCTAEPGSLSNGAACGSDAQCQSGHCRSADDCGVCGPAPGPGDACSGADACAPGFGCTNGVCARVKQAGDACDSRADCPNSLTCNAGRCAAAKGAGETCTDDACDGHAGVNCVNDVCRTTQYAAPGQPCDLANGVDCAAGGFCRLSASGLQGTCVAPAKDGESCDDQEGPRCLLWASCTGGYCKVADAAACR